jgi:hypothetical protein
MGSMKYGDEVVGFDDRLLAHLQIVIMSKFRRGESFVMSWLDGVETGDGRSSIWLEPHHEIYFRFAGSRVPQIDRGWLALLTESADSSTGLLVMDGKGNLARSTRTTMHP